VVRALASHARSHRFKSYTAHFSGKQHGFAEEFSPVQTPPLLPSLEILSMLMGGAIRRRLEVINMANPELFEQYSVELSLKIRNKRNLKNERVLLSRFEQFLAGHPPTISLAKRHIAGFEGAPATILRYASTIKGFMKWCGEPLDDLKLPNPKHIPDLVEDMDYDKLLAAASQKRSHKDLILRDRLLIRLYRYSGLRRAELANLEVRDVHADCLMVREGKGLKDRSIPLPPEIAAELNSFCQGRKSSENVFGLTDVVITNKFSEWARKAGVKLHTHSLRHKYAQALLESGADIVQIKTLLGHADISTTQVYLGVSDKGLREAVNRLEKPNFQDANKIRPFSKTLISVADYEIKPAPYSSSSNPTMVGFCTLEVQGSDLILESLQASTSDTKAPYYLLLLAEDPADYPYNFDEVDLIQMKPVSKPLHIHPLNGLRLRLPRPDVKKIYVGVGVSPRPISFAGDDYDSELMAPNPSYFEAPVRFSFTLRYQVE